MNSKEQLQQKAKEVVAFTILANEYIHGRTNNLCPVTGAAHPVVMEKSASDRQGKGEAFIMNFLVLVNKDHPLPSGWEEALDTVKTVNSVGDEVEAERRTYEAYLLLKKDLEEHDDIRTELDSGWRSVAMQQEILDRYTAKYGADYASKVVAPPGFSEHHTGLALDLYYRLRNRDGSFRDIYYNEEMERYPEVWDKIHARLAAHGFILRYPKDKEQITGYTYEPWHIRYVGDPAAAKEIMSRPGMTLEEWLLVTSMPKMPGSG